MARKPSTMKANRTRRTPDQMIKALEEEIRRIRERAERRKVRHDPTFRHVAAAVRSLGKAMNATTDVATRKALEETRTTLKACLAVSGVELTDRSRAEAGGGGTAQVVPGAVLTYLKNNPGSSGEQVANALGTDTATLRPVMRQLIVNGHVEATGKGRGMRYRPS